MSNAVAYSYLRALELEGRLPSDAGSGSWHTTANRLIFGWGEPAEADCPQVDLPAVGRLPEPPHVPAQLLKGRRPPFYQRVRSARECQAAMANGWGVLAAFWLDQQWESPQGPLSLPAAPLAATHAVAMQTASGDLLRFQNAWPDWGDQGFATMTRQYFDAMMIEAWVIVRAFGFTVGNQAKRPGVQELDTIWRGIGNERLQSLEIYDKGADERIAWAFLNHRSARIIDIEDFYVRPEYRGRRYGTRLVNMVRRVANQLNAPLRLYVPFADSQTENPANAAALQAIIRKLRMAFRPVDVKWAAYLATSQPGGSQTPVEPPAIPPRPQASLRGFLGALSVAAAVTGGPGGLASTNVPLPTVRQDSEFDAMNQRRIDLIERKHNGGLQPQEAAELATLQAAVAKRLDERHPRPPLDMTQPDELKRLAGGR